MRASSASAERPGRTTHEPLTGPAAPRRDAPVASAASTPPRCESSPSPASTPPRCESSLSPLSLGTPDDVARLKRQLLARARSLRRTPDERAAVIGEVVRRWRGRGDPFREAGLASLVGEGRFTASTAAAGLDATLRPWDPPAWRRLAAKLGEDPWRTSRSVVPHILGSALPAPNLLPLFMTLLAGAPTLARAGRWIPGFPSIAVASVAAVDPELAALAAVCRWPRERVDLTRALWSDARVGSATGGDEAVGAVAGLLARGTRLLAHPDKVSFACVGPSALSTPRRLRATAARLARDVALHDQLGCLSPVGVIVQADPSQPGATGDRAKDAAGLAAALARALEQRERAWPRSNPDLAEALAIRSFHDRFAARPAGARARPPILAGPGLRWAVAVLDPAEVPPDSPLHRCVWVASAAPAEATGLLGRWRGRTAALGFRGAPQERAVAAALARALGATRLCALGRMQSPPLEWRQDGLHPLHELLR